MQKWMFREDSYLKKAVVPQKYLPGFREKYTSRKNLHSEPENHSITLPETITPKSAEQINGCFGGITGSIKP